MERKYYSGKKIHPIKTHKLIASIRDGKKRNLLRGLSSQEKMTTQDIEAIRKDASSHDIAIIGSLLKGPKGFLDPTDKKLKAQDLFKMTSFSTLDWEHEISYTVGYINSRLDRTFEMVQYIKKLAAIELIETKEALKILLEMGSEYGASNFLSYKLVFWPNCPRHFYFGKYCHK